MVNDRRYKRYFIILENEDQGFEKTDKGVPKGYAKIEVRNGKGLLNVYVQDLKYFKDAKYIYRNYLISTKGEKSAYVDTGAFIIDERGKGELKVKFNPDNVEGSARAIEDFNVVAVIARPIERSSQQNEVYGPLVGYIDKEKVNWKEVLAYEDKKKDVDNELDKEYKQKYEKIIDVIEKSSKELYKEDIEEKDNSKKGVENKEVKKDIEEYSKEPEKEQKEYNKHPYENKKAECDHCVDSLEKYDNKEVNEEIEPAEKAPVEAEAKEAKNKPNQKESSNKNKPYENKAEVKPAEKAPVEAEAKEAKNKPNQKESSNKNKPYENKAKVKPAEKAPVEAEAKEVKNKPNQKESSNKNKPYENKAEIKPAEKAPVKTEAKEAKNKPNQKESSNKNKPYENKAGAKPAEKAPVEAEAKEDKNKKYGKKEEINKGKKRNDSEGESGVHYKKYHKMVYKYVKDMLKYYEKIQPFEKNIKGYTWWKVHYDNQSMHRGFLPFFGYILNIYYFNPYIHYMNNCQNLMNKYGHYAFGIAYDKDREPKHYVYGVPGRYMYKDQPFRGMTGFVSWYPLEDKNPEKGDYGYWLLHIDAKTGNVVFPMKPTVPPVY